MNTATAFKHTSRVSTSSTSSTRESNPVSHPKTKNLLSHGSYVDPLYVKPGTHAPKRIDPAHPPSNWDRVQIRLRDQQSQLLANTPTKQREFVPSSEKFPDPANWCATLCACTVEVLVGTRPVSQLARWITSELYAGLEQRIELAIRIEGTPQVLRTATIRSFHMQQTDKSSRSPIEGCALVHDGKRLRAVAIRLEAFRGRWRATALEIG